MKQQQDWTQPGAYPVADGIFRIPLPLPQDGLRAVNVYVIEAGSVIVLVDGGWALKESRTALESSLVSIDYKVSDIVRCLVTHAHRDHYTQAVAIREEFGSFVSLGIGEKATLDFIRDSSAEVDPSVGRLFRSGARGLAEDWQRSPASKWLSPSGWELPDEWLMDGQIIDLGVRQLQAISTPGHTQGHFVFVERQAGLLFAGDHVLPTITPSIGYEPVVSELPLGDFISSLAKIRRMPDMLLLPGHGPIASSVHARVDELLAHHDERLSRCQAAVKAGNGTAYAVAGELPWTRRNRRLSDLDTFNAMLAVLETLVHLELLANQGRVSHDLVDGVLQFR